MHKPARLYQADTQIWAGALLGDADSTVVRARIDWLQHNGVTHIIDLTTPADACPAYAQLLALHAPNMVRHEFPIRDMGVPSPACMLAILDTMSAIVARGATVYVHCWGGKGRTGTVIALALMRLHDFSAREAMAWLRILRPGSVIGDQQRYLNALEPFLRPSSAAKLSASPSPPPPSR